MPVYDRSYRRWEGEFLRRPARWLPIWTTGLRLALRKTTALKTLVFYAFLFASATPFLILFLLNYLYFFPPDSLSTQVLGFLTEAEPLQKAQYPLLVQMFFPRGILMVVTVLFGSGLVAADRAVSALPLYLSRPMTRLDYIVGKWSVVATFLAALTLFPALVLWAFDRRAVHLAAIFAFFVPVVVVYSTTILAISALCRRAMVAGLIWFGWLTVVTTLSLVLAFRLGAVSLLALSPQHCFAAIAHRVFRLEELQEVEGGTELLRVIGLHLDLPPLWLASLSLALHTLLAGFVLFRALRAEEVSVAES